MSDLQNIAQSVHDALAVNNTDVQIAHGKGYSLVITPGKVFEIYETGTDVFVQVATRGTFEPVGDDTMWWATVPGESNPHFSDEALEAYRYGDEAEYRPFDNTMSLPSSSRTAGF